MKNIGKLISLVLIFSMIVCALPVYAVESTDATSEIPYTSPSGKFANNYNSKVNVYDSQSAVTAGIPSGYSGYVLKVVPDADGSYAGIELDFSTQNIPIEDIEAISFRVILPSGHSEMRLLGELAPTTWVMRKAPDVFGAWSNITISADGTNFYQGANMSALANSKGNLGRMCLIGRMGSGSDKGFYLDSVSIIYKNGVSQDMTAPIINYDGATVLNFTEGDIFSVDGLTAFDEYDNSSAVISYEWSAGATDTSGSLKVGTHICTVKATDRSGNTSELSLTVIVKADSSLLRFDKIPSVPHDTSIAAADYDGNVRELTYDSAVASGVPYGFKDSVYEISYKSGKSYIGVCLDFSEFNIPISLVESISFDVFMPTNYSELRMRNGNTSDWILRCSAAVSGGWTTVTMKADGHNFYGSSNMKTLANHEGNLGSFCLIGRNTGTYAHYYIDGITVKLKKDDGRAPVLSYSGETDVITSAGKTFNPEISAYDELEMRFVKLDYAWSEGALDEKGNMLEGIHTCRVSACDYFGNTSYIDLKVTVGPPDVDAPVIKFTASEIYVTEGTFYRMLITAEDNYDAVKVTEEWSDGAVDFGGRLLAGTHLLTLTSVDLSGNKTVHIVTVYVVKGDSTVGTLIQCGK